MIRNYTCFISGTCLKNGEGKWAVLSCPQTAKWTVSLSGKAKCKDVTKLYLLGTIAALDDLIVRCSVTVVVDNLNALDVLEEIGSDLNPEISQNATAIALIKLFDLHQVTLAYMAPDNKSVKKHWNEVHSQLKAF